MFNIASLLRFYLVVIIVLFIDVLVGYGQDRAELEKRREAARNDIERTNKILNEVSKSKSLTINRIVVLNRQIKRRQDLISDLDLEIDNLNTRIFDNQYVIKSLGGDTEKIKADYAKLIQAAYKQKPPFFELTYLFSSGDINQAYKRMKYIKQYARYRQRQVTLIRRIQKLLETKEKELKEQKNSKNLLLKDIESEKTKLRSEKNSQQKMVTEFGRKEKDLKKKLAQKRSIARKLDKAIEKAIEIEAKNENGIFKLTPEQKLISEKFVNNKGKLPWPTTTGIVTEKYGEHPHPVWKHVRVRNDGINVTTSEGEVARSVFDGIVMKVFAIPGANQTVIIRHGNYLSVYTNLIGVKVKVGDNVVTKQKLGIIYTNRSEGNDTTLHFMLWKEKDKLDPELWLSK